VCEFCLQHGEGRKWYLRASNYAEDLLSDARRRQFIVDFFSRGRTPGGERRERHRRRRELLKRLPVFVRRILRIRTSRRLKRRHFGQVVPIEEVDQILGMVNSIVRLPCVCRHARFGRDERYCYGVSTGPGGGRLHELLRGVDDSFLQGPDNRGLEVLTREQASAAFRQHESEGLCHTVWTFVTPFIGGICNCDRSDCMAIRSTLTDGLKTFFRAEHVAEVNPEACDGCRSCMRFCQFGALGYSAATRRVVVDQTACYGCGLCRSACPRDAVVLKPRQQVPTAAGLW
jgi:ferredoxin